MVTSRPNHIDCGRYLMDTDYKILLKNCKKLTCLLKTYVKSKIVTSRPNHIDCGRYLMDTDYKTLLKNCKKLTCLLKTHVTSK